MEKKNQPDQIIERLELIAIEFKNYKIFKIPIK